MTPGCVPSDSPFGYSFGPDGTPLSDISIHSIFSPSQNGLFPSPRMLDNVHNGNLVQPPHSWQVLSNSNTQVTGNDASVPGTDEAAVKSSNVLANGINQDASFEQGISDHEENTMDEEEEDEHIDRHVMHTSHESPVPSQSQISPIFACMESSVMDTSLENTTFKRKYLENEFDNENVVYHDDSSRDMDENGLNGLR